MQYIYICIYTWGILRHRPWCRGGTYLICFQWQTNTPLLIYKVCLRHRPWCRGGPPHKSIYICIYICIYTCWFTPPPMVSWLTLDIFLERNTIHVCIYMYSFIHMRHIAPSPVVSWRNIFMVFWKKQRDIFLDLYICFVPPPVESWRNNIIV